MLLNIKQEDQREVHLVALPILKVLLMLCKPLTIYCAKKNYFKEQQRGSYSMTELFENGKQRRNGGESLIEMESVPWLSVESVLTRSYQTGQSPGRKGKQ